MPSTDPEIASIKEVISEYSTAYSYKSDYYTVSARIEITVGHFLTNFNIWLTKILIGQIYCTFLIQ